MRYELKYIFSENEVSKFFNWFHCLKSIKKIYNSRKIYNIYYDDLNLSSAQDNLTGLSVRKKYRLRWYEYKNIFSNQNFEIKLKENRLNYKKIFKLNKKVDESNYSNIFNRKYKYFASSLNENKKIFLFNKLLFPVLKNSYLRDYYSYENQIRITLDYPCEYFDLNSLKSQSYLNKFFVLEFKFDPSKTDIAKKIIINMPFRISRFSKYMHGLKILKKISFY